MLNLEKKQITILRALIFFIIHQRQLTRSCSVCRPTTVRTPDVASRILFMCVLKLLLRLERILFLPPSGAALLELTTTEGKGPSDCVLVSILV